MCKQSDSIDARRAAAEQLKRACASKLPWCEDLLRDPATVEHLPAVPTDITELTERLKKIN